MTSSTNNLEAVTLVRLRSLAEQLAKSINWELRLRKPSRVGVCPAVYGPSLQASRYDEVFASRNGGKNENIFCDKNHNRGCADCF